MLFDGNDVVRTKVYYKNLDYRVDGTLVTHRVFVDWGESYCEDFVLYGSPFQIGNGFVPRGSHVPDCPVLFDWELVRTSAPQNDHPAPASLTNGPLHYKPGVNI